jgi:hypothetical protein
MRHLYIYLDVGHAVVAWSLPGIKYSSSCVIRAEGAVDSNPVRVVHEVRRAQLSAHL